MSRRRSFLPLSFLSLALLAALSCRLVTGQGTPVPQAVTSAVATNSVPRLTGTSTQAAPAETATAVVVITFTATSLPEASPTLATQPSYPGPDLTSPPTIGGPYPGPIGTPPQILSPSPGAQYTFPAPATEDGMATLEAQLTQTSGLTPNLTTTLTPSQVFVPAPSATPVFVPTFTPTLPANLNLTGNWFGFRKITYQFRDCEESIAHSLRWRIYQFPDYTIQVNNSLGGWLKGNVVVLSGIEEYNGGSLDLTYILTVGPTRHELSGYMYGKARLPHACGSKGLRLVNVPNGRLDVER